MGNSTVEFKKKLTDHDEKFLELETQMINGFSEIKNLIIDKEPAYDVVKTGKTILATFVAISSFYAMLTYAIKAEVAVPINEGKRMQNTLVEFQSDVITLSQKVNALNTQLTTVKESVDGNSNFVYKYLQEDKVPVEMAIINGKLEMHERQLNTVINFGHKKGK